MLHRPPDSVVRAFGADPGQLVRLPGGQGTSWRAGDLVLKPGDAPVQRWLSSTLRELEPAGLRLAVPVAAAGGAWSVAGWTATSFVHGQEPDLRRPTSWPKVVAAGRLFHHALAGTPRPALLDSRTDPWAVADRVAWGEQHTQFHPAFDDVAGRLRAQPDPPGPAQRSEEHTSELQSRGHLVCRLLLEKKKSEKIRLRSSSSLCHAVAHMGPRPKL